MRPNDWLTTERMFLIYHPMTDEQAEECAKVYSEIFNVKNVPGAVTVFPGVIETLERLSAQGVLMSIASSRSHRTLAKLMNELDLSKYITYLIAADDVVEKKPAAESVLKTCVILTSKHTKPSSLVIPNSTFSWDEMQVHTPAELPTVMAVERV